jgi:hypothetical protein
MYGRVEAAMTTAVSNRLSASDEDDCDNKPMWSLEIASAWARLDAACGCYALAESEPLITAALAMLPRKFLKVARAGYRSPSKQGARYSVP